jgi:aspartate aminotransferase
MSPPPSRETPESETVPHVSLVDIFLKARELERRGQEVIHFDAGEPDFEPPTQVLDATIRALKEGKSRYTESPGISTAREAISERLERKYASNISPSQVLVTAGGRLALYFSYTLLPRNAKVGIISPDWPAYRNLAEFLSLRARFFEGSLEEKWDVDLDEVRKGDCDAIVLNYPNNPTGKILGSKLFEELVNLARERNMLLISDEVYSDYILDKSKRFKSVLETKDLRYVLVSSLSKSYAMTGYRSGYLVSDEKTTARLSKLNGLVMTSTAEFVQYAIIAAMSCDDYVAEKVELIRKRSEIAASSLKKYLDAEFYPPDGSLYVFPRLHSGKENAFDSEEFAVKLLERELVSVAPGTSFGKAFNQHIRITLLQAEQKIEEGIQRMANILMK